MSPAPFRPQAAGTDPSRWMREMRLMIRLALPTTLTRMGLVLMISADLMMVGRAGTLVQAGYGVAMPLAITLMLMGVGFTVAVAVLTAQALGAKRSGECAEIWVAGSLIALCNGLLLAALLGEGHLLIRLIDPAGEIREGGLWALRGFAPGMPAILLYSCAALFLEGLGRPGHALLVIILGNLVNLFLNFWWIPEGIGPFTGPASASLATSAARWVMAIVAIWLVLRQPDAGQLGLRAGIGRLLVRSLRNIGKQFRIGFAMMLALAVESIAFATIAVMAGWMGAQVVASYQILINMLAVIFMVAIGISTATALRVGHAVGRGDAPGMRQAGWAGASLVSMVMAVFCLMLFVFRETVVRFYTPEPELWALVLPLVPVIAISLMFDGLQAVLMGALRGLGDVRFPILIQFAAFWGGAVCFAWWFGVRGGTGLDGLIQAMLVGMVLSALLVTIRFLKVARRPVRML